jgi:DOPA 4,5-dioxygenase
VSSAPGAPWHAHIYYERRTRDAAQSLRAGLTAMEAVLYAGALCDEPVGPHPQAQFEVHFCAVDLPAIRHELVASGLRALIHPLTDDDLADHTVLGEWLGDPLPLDLAALDPPGVNQGLARFGRSEF